MSARQQQPKPSKQRRLHPLPRGLVELYGLIAVLIVLIPEWLADGTLNFGQIKGIDTLPMHARAWQALPELRLASMSLFEMRILAQELRFLHYAMDTRARLTARLLRRLSRCSAL
ncbi:hypothetical protein [Synechococcus sp. M16CYN]|uniref:hypothetical protein n=1 Tax=Synechococcus sp. M16CYN TaxID=3103139 RepID=UPI00324DB58F